MINNKIIESFLFEPFYYQSGIRIIIRKTKFYIFKNTYNLFSNGILYSFV